MNEATQRMVETNGIRLHLAEQGAGPLVVLCHGFPESWYSWRHQLAALAAAGFHAVAPDMRGYGQSDRPEEIDRYTLFHLVGDMVGVLDALKAEQAVIVGHDWGAPVAWSAALLRPDRFRAVIGLSVPYIPRGRMRPTSVMPQNADALFYQLYFQSPGKPRPNSSATWASRCAACFIRPRVTCRDVKVASTLAWCPAAAGSSRAREPPKHYRPGSPRQT